MLGDNIWAFQKVVDNVLYKKLLKIDIPWAGDFLQIRRKVE